MRKIKLLLVFILVSVSAKAQSLLSSKLEGRVYSKDGDIAATHVLNTTTKRATITDINGFFTIPVNLHDTLLISAVQFKRKEIVITTSILKSSFLSIPLEDALTQLDEVIVVPYNLTGNMARDMKRLSVEPIITASTLDLPNAYMKPISKAERELFAATTNPYLSFDPLINAITGRTKMLKKRVARNKAYERTQRVRAFYVDSLFRTDLQIPEAKIADFMYFCEVDTAFQKMVDTHDHLKIWDYLRKKSIIYRKQNKLLDTINK